MARFGLALLAPLLLFTTALAAAQVDWKAEQKASGWAVLDRDGSCNFFDPATRKLINWTWEGGVQNELDLGRIPALPEKWVLDSSNNAWCVAGTTLQYMHKNGQTGTSITLPAEVSDLAWDARSFVLCYRAQELYLEKRDLKSGSILWTYGPKPAKGARFAQNLHHLAIKEDGQVLVSSGNALLLTVLDGDKGKLLDTVAFTLDGGALPALTLGSQDRGALSWWLGTNFAVAAVPASQLPTLKREGLLLVKLDLAERKASIIATGLSEGHALVGIQEKRATFRVPTRGLTYLDLE